MDISNYQSEYNNLVTFVDLIVNKGKIKNNKDKKEKWSSFKKENEPEIRNLLNIPDELKDNPCNLVSFDIDEEKNLLLLNYTSQAHNVLHVYKNGWSNELKLCRGLVFSIKNKIKLVSRGFEKFFNANETKKSLQEELTRTYDKDQIFDAYEKIDGHMIEFFEHENKMCATTRGKFNTISSKESLSLISYEEWNQCKDYLLSKYNINLMTIVAELVTPFSKVLVDYFNDECVYILASYDDKGNKISYDLLKEISSFINKSKLPEKRKYTLSEMFKEVLRRDINNHEGWVLNLDGVLLKFKYNNYIGMMVSNKMCYKYLMQTMINKTTNKMVSTLDKESIKEVELLLNNIDLKVTECRTISTYKPLYELWSDEEGSLNYFRLVCRKFYKNLINV